MIWCLLVSTRVVAQPAGAASFSSRDTAITLTDFLKLVVANHPLTRQARLLPEMAQAELMGARGAFDPTIDVHWNRKDLWNYKENWTPATYFQNWNNFLKVPVWFGDAKIGYEQYKGINVNPENFTPPDGLIYLDISLPLGPQLLIDERRAMLKQAELGVQLNEAEKIKLINKTILEATKAYCAWYEADVKSQIYARNLALGIERLEFIRRNIVQGSSAPVDSVEALMEVYKRQAELENQQLEQTSARLRASVFIWTDDLKPLELSTALRPQNPISNLTSSGSNGLNAQHPELQKLSIKAQQLGWEYKWRRAELFPMIDFNLKPMFIPGQAEFTGRYFQENYKVGFNFYTPIFLRKQRAKLQSVKLKQRAVELEQQYTQQFLQREADATFAETQALGRMLRLQEQSVEQADVLVDVEKTRFQIGETTLFVLNARERSRLSTYEKLIELQAKSAKAEYTLRYVLGLPLLNIQP
jgi:outer membrane protein TolC